MYPWARDPTALKAMVCPIVGNWLVDSILEHDPNLRLAEPWPVLTVILSAEIPLIVPYPFVTELGFRQLKLPERLKPFPSRDPPVKGNPN